jgi:hypothetical protein
MDINEKCFSGFTSDIGDNTGNSGDCFKCNYPGKNMSLNA